MLLLKGAQNVLQQQGNSGGQGLESLRHLGEERWDSVSGRRGRGSFDCTGRMGEGAAGESTGNKMEREMNRREVGLRAR